MNPEPQGRPASNRATAPRDDTLYLNIECPRTPDHSSGNKHTVSIHYGADWAVETPHDLQAERIAAALGGYCACLDLIDKTIPAIRANMDHLTRRAEVTMAKNRRGQIHILRGETTRHCCTGWSFDSVAEASWHLRSAHHISNYNDAPLWQIEKVLKALERKIKPRFEDYNDVEERLPKQQRVSQLWGVGIHPKTAREYLALVPAVTEPLPLDYFIGVAYSGLNKDWLREVAAARPNAETATWLAWVPDLTRHAGIPEWKTWLKYGLSTNDTEIALIERITSEVVNATAHATGWQPSRAAAALTAWAKAGCSPTIEHIQLLARNGRSHVGVTDRQLNQLWNQTVEDTRIELRELQRTELGVLLALLGHPDAVLTALHHGIYSVHDLQSTENESTPRRAQ